MNALLIYPRFPDTFWGFKHALRLIRKKASSPPLGLLTVASMLPDDWELRLVDDNLIGNRRKLLTELLPALIGWRAGKWGMSFSTQVTVNLADDAELMDLMARAGFDTVFVGIESVDEASLSECNKRQNEHRDLLDHALRIQRAGMQVQGGFIVGFDHDTPTVFERMAAFIQQSGIATAMVGMLQAPAGTRLHKRLSGEGRIRNVMSGDNVDGTTNIVPTMGVEPLEQGYRSMMAKLYSPANYYARLRTFPREYRPRPARARLHGWHVLAFFRSLYYLGIVGQERFRYQGFLIWTLFRNPRAFPTAIVLAISGYHLRICLDALPTT